MGTVRWFVVWTAVASLLVVVVPGRAAQKDYGDDGGHPVIAWVGAVATNVFYLPAKVIYAGLGGLTGGFGWILTGGDTDAAKGIWDPTVRGTYIITPSMLEGKEDVRFIGP